VRDEFDAWIDWRQPLNPKLVENETAIVEGVSEGLRAASKRLKERFPAAAQFYWLDRWIAAKGFGPAGRRLFSEMLTGAIAMDHYVTKTPVPSLGSRRWRHPAWRLYFEARRTAMVERFGVAVSRWAVLARVPVDWIPHDFVFEGLQTQMSDLLTERPRFSGRLAAPLRGGADWVNEDCRSDPLQSAPALGGEVIYRDALPVVSISKDTLRTTPGTSLGPPLTPPVDWVTRQLRRAGLGLWAWRRSRGWRRYFGAR
jgi:hypothetical protein